MTLFFREISQAPTSNWFFHCPQEKYSPNMVHEPRLTGHVKQRSQGGTGYVQYGFKCPCWHKTQWSIYAGPGLLWGDVRQLGNYKPSELRLGKEQAVHNSVAALAARRKDLEEQISDLLGRADRLADQLAAAEAAEEQARERLDKFGYDNWPVGTVFQWDHTFDRSQQTYTYTALKCPNDQWYTSGPKSPGPYSWDTLISFISRGVTKDGVWVVKEWSQVMTP